MMFSRSCAVARAWLLLALAQLPAMAQQSPSETVSSLTPADGFEVKLFAAEPMVVNPIAIDIDTYGRVWVTEGTKYRKNVADPPDDRIKVLEDTDGDGVADKMTVFASDLNAAMGICVAGSKIYVPESPNLYVYQDENNDLVPDGPRQTLLTGFGGQNHDHGLHSQVFGPDHKLYMTNGDSGYDVTGPDGKNVKFRWGAMLRCESDGTKLEDFAVNFRNPIELAVDSFGNVWCSDNDNDGLKSVRICWILEGGNYGWFGQPENIRNADGSFDPIHHWRADLPGFVPYVMITGFGSPCGMTFYEYEAFGPKYAGKIVHCDAGPREIRCYSPERLPGVGYRATIENIVTSSDRYFRPVDPCVAPDGSIYVTDWYDGGVGGHAYNDPTRGRIYRITPKGRKLEPTAKPGPYRSNEEALAALGSPNLATQFLAREKLLAGGQTAAAGLTSLAKGTDRIRKARALWLLDRLGSPARDAVREQLNSTDLAFRALAVRILRRHGDQYLPEILPLVNDADGEVLKEALLALGGSNSKAAIAALVKAFARYDGHDRYLLETLGVASRGREEQIFKEVVEKAGPIVAPRLVDIVRVLRPEDALKYFSERLAAPNVSEEAARTLVEGLSSIATIEAGKATLGVLASNAAPVVRRLALAALNRNLRGAWGELKQDPALSQSLEKAMGDETLAADALRVIGDAGVRGAAPLVKNVLYNAAASRADRLAAIDSATQLGLDDVAPQLALLVAGDDEQLRTSALKALVVLRDTKELGALFAAPASSAALKQQAADLLMTSSDGALFLLRLIDTKKLDQKLTSRVVAAAVQHPDVNVRLLFEKFTPADQRPKTLGQSFTPEQILALPGDAGRGEAVFLRSGAASCSKCHRVKGHGAEIGPDLSQIGRKYERRALLETIMNPSAGIAPEYVPYVVETDAGKVYAGFLADQNDGEVVLKTIEGVVVRVPKSNVIELAKQEKSLMPELVLGNITAQDAADLLAFLVSLQEATVHATTFKLLGPFPNVRLEQRDQDFGPETAATPGDLAGGDAAHGKPQASWATIAAQRGSTGVPEVNGDILASTLKKSPENAIYYFATTLDSAAAQPATLYIGSDDGVQVWVNGRKVHDAKVSRALTPGDDRVPVSLNQGKNLILLKLDQSGGPVGLALSAEARAHLAFDLP